MWWRKKSKAKKTRREELIEARDRLRRELEILGAGPVLVRDRTPQTPRLYEELSIALGEIEAELAELGNAGQ